jgi:hypothetical protein
MADAIEDRGGWPCEGKHSDSNTVDLGIDGGIYDWSDQDFLPTAYHQYQHYEWLGTTVDQEDTVNIPNDNATLPKSDNDGLLRVAQDVYNGLVKVEFKVSTSYTAHPDAFPINANVYVDCWIDWNDNEYFTSAEYVGRWRSNPYGWGGDNIRNGSIVAGAGGLASEYNIRLRLIWSYALLEANPGGFDMYGEVEDYVAFKLEPEDLDPPTPVPSLTTYGIIALVLLLLGTAVWVTRRNRAGDLT